jgi:hypothetical protein
MLTTSRAERNAPAWTRGAIDDDNRHCPVTTSKQLDCKDNAGIAAPDDRNIAAQSSHQAVIHGRRGLEIAPKSLKPEYIRS